MKNTVVALLVTLLAQPCSALSGLPARCPSIAMVKSGGVDSVYFDAIEGWLGRANDSKYDTDETWSFSVFAGTSATNAEDALALARLRLTGIDNVIGPFEFEKSGQAMKYWGCSYFGEGFGLALTPMLPDL